MSRNTRSWMTLLSAALGSLVLVVGAATASAQYRLPRRPSQPRVVAPSSNTIGSVASRIRTQRLAMPSSTSVTITPSRPGAIACDVRENGARGPASVAVRRGRQLVASGDCGSPLSVPAGTYDVTLTLESALDRPTRTLTMRVPEGGQVTASARFDTSILEVRFTDDRAPVHGYAVILRDGVEVGSVGSRVPVSISAGTYQIRARYRTDVQTYTVTLAPGQRRALRAAF